MLYTKLFNVLTTRTPIMERAKIINPLVVFLALNLRMINLPMYFHWKNKSGGSVIKLKPRLIKKRKIGAF